MPDPMKDRIRAAILAIPRGSVSTYGAVARAAGYPGAARQVVAVLRASYGLPWHRVLGAGGHIKLRGESALEQRLRLEAEGVTFRGQRVDMKGHAHRFAVAPLQPKAGSGKTGRATPETRRPGAGPRGSRKRPTRR